MSKKPIRTPEEEIPLNGDKYFDDEIFDRVEVETRRFQAHGFPKNNLTGEPRPELEKAWHELLDIINIRFTEEEVDAIGPGRKELAIKLPDGGYYGSLNVLHDIHCVKHLHRSLYPGVYYKDFNSTERAASRAHSEHCLDRIRQSLMCGGDLSPITYYWYPNMKLPAGNFSAPHQCMNWDRIVEWSKRRSIPRFFEKGYINNPQYGPLYGDDFHNEVGAVRVYGNDGLS